MKRMAPEQYWMDVASVMTARVTTLPMMWMLRPGEAARETQKMFSEKDDAMKAVQQQMMLAPMKFWFDAWAGALKGDVDLGMNRARDAAELRMSHPYTSRVSANRKRLSKTV